ncbi:unnamed protein product [Leptidea sinapis]|uniref:Uncharacterized protein n=1 Tax=Leptidea sinapis TaxID=189913 RepID=A0A5E4QXG9_9NEOP|nr:unnamed protein product [Leptidea sinapis]
MESCINTIVDRINDLDKEVSKVNSYQIELNDLKQKINELSEGTLRNDQWVRRSNIQINGIPHKKCENLIQIVKSLASKSGYCSNPDTDIDFVTRVAIKNDSVENKPRPIILKMQARYKKDDFLSSLRKIKNLKASDLGYAGVNTSIYANDHLTTYNTRKSLLNEARRRAKEKGFMYCWVLSQGKTMGSLKNQYTID